MLTVGLLFAANEVLLYGLTRWAGERELDIALQKDVEMLASAIVVERDGDVDLRGDSQWEEVQLYGRASLRQVMMDDGSTVCTVWRSRNTADRHESLPAIDGKDIPLNEMRIADGTFGRLDAVRSAGCLQFANVLWTRRKVERTKPHKVWCSISERSSIEAGSTNSFIASCGS